MPALRALRNANYRTWAVGAFASNVGTWTQRTAEVWLVLTQLTDHSASAVGIVMALQLSPQLFLLPLIGYAADHFDKRTILLITQSFLGGMALLLGALTVSGAVQLWHVYLMTLLSGCVTALDTTVRQVFVTELVGEDNLPNAVALNSTSFNTARMVGPAVAGALIASVGTGWAFLFNGASYIAVLASLLLLRVDAMHRGVRAQKARGSFLGGFGYVRARPELMTIFVMLFIFGTFGLNFPIFISTMAVQVFHTDAHGFALLTSVMAAGTVVGAVLAAGRERPKFFYLLISAIAFGFGCTLAAFAPTLWIFGAVLVVIGVSGLTFTNSTNSLTQLATEPAMRGRVMALRLAIFMGGTPIGAPIVGFVADRYGARWSLGVGAAAGFVAAGIGLWYLVKHPQRRPSDGAN